MKKLFFIALMILGVTAHAQQENVEINWMTMNEALAAQKEAPKNIIMDAYTVWCGPCKMLDKNTFGHPQVAQFINENYYPVKFNAEGEQEINYKDKIFSNPQYDPELKARRNSPHEFARALNISAYPSIVFFDEQGELIAPLKGYRSPEQIEIFLKIFAKDEYKNLTSEKAWKEYNENFKPTFTK
ncbi:thioredoxin family protein [Zunongwangia sp. HRR-M8]|uniref:thioredoxin family protein n=1 Tax=Zunongwangia sp. HRR-M8 TaxID=3015170 RepID=UPI0022DE53E2|nr:thioredoxin fold domain-containing protein [Zunongwangia sp. HRR-M8]WBL21956.1 thioredoxin fold domain-containing protein [Zunongwangia sp. HRR-M8]